MVTLSADTKTLLGLAKKIIAEGVKNEELLLFTRRKSLTLDGHVSLTEAEIDLLKRSGIVGYP